MIIGFLLGIIFAVVIVPCIKNIFDYFDFTDPDIQDDEYEDI